MNATNNENLFKEWWQTVEAGQHRQAGVLLTNMTDWNPAGIKALAKAAFLAGRQTMMPKPIKEAEDELELLP